MKRQILFFVIMLLPFVASAHDIEVANGDGMTIYYPIEIELEKIQREQLKKKNSE